MPYTQDYINQIIPLLQTLYSQSAQQVLVQGGVPPPVSNTTYLPPAYESLQKLLSEIARGLGTIIIHVSLRLYLVSPLVPQKILVMAPELQEDLLGTKVKRVTLTLVIYIF